MIFIFLTFWNMWRQLMLSLPQTPIHGHLADRCNVCGACFHQP